MTKFGKFSTQTYVITSIFFVILLMIVALIHYRDDIFQSLQDPGQPFQTYQKPEAPNYNLAKNWMDLPDLATDAFEHPGYGDVFVVIPVLFKGGDHWNLPITRESQIDQLNRIIRPNYVAPYHNAGRVFAPFYRQASLYTYMTNREDGRLAQDLAYRDVADAFEFFLKHSPKERPIILAGHGQGASHVQRLLADYFQGELKERLAAAYVIDHPLPLDKFGKELANLAPCESESDTKCVIAWGAFMPGDAKIAERFSTRLNVYENGDYYMVNDRPLLCINPLSWSRSSDYAPIRLHKGGMAAIGLEPDAKAAPLSMQFGAECQNGLLYIDKPKSRVLRRPLRIGRKYRTLPFNLFYEDIKENSALRVESLINEGVLPKRVEKLDQLEVIEIVDSPVVPVTED
ncbi:MAG: DUF3089 domain-containing protein [Hellea sp.]|nr:DUF3089 domain-containing protein [Hellea sp.]